MKYPLLLFFAVLFSCSQDRHTEKDNQGMLLQKADSNIYTGKIVEYYEDVNQQKFIALYQNGIKNGDYISWHKNGKIKVKGKYSKDKRVGLWQWFNERGDLKYQLNYQS